MAILSVASFIPPAKKADAYYIKAIYPLYVETFAGFFKGVSGGAPTGVANFPSASGSLTVSGTVGSSTLTVNSINVGAVSDYGGPWAAIIDFGDGTYQVLNATNVTANSIDIYPTLSRTISSVNMGNLHDSVLGQHLSPLGYQALASYVYNYDRKTAVKNRYADIHGFAGSYYTTGWNYGAEIGAPFSLTGGLTNGGYLGFITKGISNCNCLPYAASGKPWTGADRTGYYSNGNVRTSVGGNIVGQGATKTATLGGKSGFFESFVGVDGQSQVGTLPGRARGQLWIDGVLVYDQTFSSLTKIAVPFEHATTSTFTVTMADSIATSIGIGQTTWWTVDPDEESATLGDMIPPGSSVMIDMDSWGTFYNNAFETKLTSLMTADSGGAPVVVRNASIPGTTAAQQLANYDNDVLPYHPDYVIIDYAINDTNQGLTPAQYQASLDALIQHIVDSGSIPIVLGNLATASSTQTVRLAGAWPQVMTNTSAVTPNIQYDTTAPTIPGTPSTTTPTNNNKPTWTWTASTDSESGLADPAYTLQWSQDPTFVSSVSSSTSNTNSFTHSTSLADGTWYFRVLAGDSDNNSSSYSGNGSVVVDTSVSSTPTPFSTATAAPTPSSTSIGATARPWWWRLFYGTLGTTAPSSASFTTIPTDLTNIEVGQTITFDASSSGSNIIIYEWNFGDGTTSNEMKVDHKYDTPGRYTVALTTTDKSDNKSTVSKTIDIRPPAPTISDIKADGTSIIINGKSFPGTTVFLTIHSDPYSAQTITDKDGNWSYTLENASYTIGQGDHTILASAGVIASDGAEIEGKDSKTYDFKVSIDDGKLKVEMGKTRIWRYVSLGLILIIVIGFVLYRVRKNRKT